MEEDYCSFEVAKLLKEKGFKCGATYSKGFVKDGDGFVGGLVRHEDKITHQMAMKWLRERHNLHIEVIYNPYYKEYKACMCGAIGDYNYTEFYSTYEEAVEAALKYSLENLI